MSFGGSAVFRAGVQAAASHYLNGPGSRPLGICNRAFQVVLLVVYILNPFPDITVRDLAFSNLPFIMSLNLSLGDIEYENIDCDSEWGIPTNGGFDCSFG
jgi:hypothetical protein